MPGTEEPWSWNFLGLGFQDKNEDKRCWDMKFRCSSLSFGLPHRALSPTLKDVYQCRAVSLLMDVAVLHSNRAQTVDSRTWVSPSAPNWLHDRYHIRLLKESPWECGLQPSPCWFCKRPNVACRVPDSSFPGTITSCVFPLGVPQSLSSHPPHLHFRTHHFSFIWSHKSFAFKSNVFHV